MTPGLLEAAARARRLTPAEQKLAEHYRAELTELERQLRQSCGHYPHPGDPLPQTLERKRRHWAAKLDQLLNAELFSFDEGGGE